MKTCGKCGESYTLDAWTTLPLCGYQPEGKDVAGEVLELRRCLCGSSLAIDLGDEPDSIPPPPRHSGVFRGVRCRPIENSLQGVVHTCDAHDDTVGARREVTRCHAPPRRPDTK